MLFEGKLSGSNNVREEIIHYSGVLKLPLMMLSEGKLSASEVVVGKTILSCSDEVVGNTIGSDAIRSRCSPRSNYTEGHNVCVSIDPPV